MNKLTRNIDRQTFVDGIARTANSTLASVFLKKKNRTPSCQTLMFVEPKIGLLPHILTFKKYETARRINNAKAINDRADVRSDELPGLLETYSNRSRKTRGVDKRDVRRTERLRGNDVNVVAEYTLDNKIDEGIKKAFPDFQGVQKIHLRV